MNTKPKKLLPPEYVSVHVTGQNKMTVDYTYWIKSGAKGDLIGYIGHTLKAPKEHNGKCVFSSKFFSWFLN